MRDQLSIDSSCRVATLCGIEGASSPWHVPESTHQDAPSSFGGQSFYWGFGTELCFIKWLIMWSNSVSRPLLSLGGPTLAQRSDSRLTCLVFRMTVSHLIGTAGNTKVFRSPRWGIWDKAQSDSFLYHRVIFLPSAGHTSPLSSSISLECSESIPDATSFTSLFWLSQCSFPPLNCYRDSFSLTVTLLSFAKHSNHCFKFSLSKWVANYTWMQTAYLFKSPHWFKYSKNSKNIYLIDLNIRDEATLW